MPIVSQLQGEKRLQICVVGAGIAGISCAYHLEKTGFEVAVIEESSVASGATNYSSGVLYFGCGTDFQTAINLFGREKAKQLWDESKQAIDDLVSLAKQIPSAGLRDTGLTIVARNEQENAYLLTEQDAMAQLGYPAKLVSGEEFSKWFTPRTFSSALHQPFCLQVKPPFLVKGIAQQLSSPVFENSAMTEIIEDEEKGEVLVKTATGAIRCQQVVVATNFRPFYGLEQHFFNEDSVDLPSQEIEGEKLLQLWPKDTVFSTPDERYDLFYRHDNKVFFEAYSMKGIEQRVLQYFPAETGIVFDKKKAYGDSWAKTKDWLPIVGKVPGRQRVHCAIAMGDQGIVMGWASGKNIARHLQKEASEFLQMCSPERFD